MSIDTNVAERKGVQAWDIDAAHTLVEFSAKHMMITTVKGRFGEVSGRIELNEDDFSASKVEVEIVAESIDTRSDSGTGTCARPTSWTSRTTRSFASAAPG